MSKLTRTEKHRLLLTPAQKADVARTIAFYQRVVRFYASIAITHAPELLPLRSKERMGAMERLTHKTKDNPNPKYALLDKMQGKMPCYLRRAAIHSGIGVASSFLSNYHNWQGDTERKQGNRPPRLGLAGVFPSLYGGNMILAPATWKSARIKLLNAQGEWYFTSPVAVKDKLKRIPKGIAQSPSLVMKKQTVWLAIPVELSVTRVEFPVPPKPNSKRKAKPLKRLCSIDVGINTAATAAIVDSSGTVIARRFLTCGRHNDQRDKLLAQIQELQSVAAKQKRKSAFVKVLYERIAGLNEAAAADLVQQLVRFAEEHKAEGFVVEDLKYWKPKGPSRKQRKRFHRFQHRALVNRLELQTKERGWHFLAVYPRGTSRYAFDGSGKLTRSKANAALATFANGKQYNADLNAAYNIAARGWNIIHPIPRSEAPVTEGQSSLVTPRIPVVLADLWLAREAPAQAA